VEVAIFAFFSDAFRDFLLSSHKISKIYFNCIPNHTWAQPVWLPNNTSRGDFILLWIQPHTHKLSYAGQKCTWMTGTLHGGKGCETGRGRHSGHWGNCWSHRHASPEKRPSGFSGWDDNRATGRSDGRKSLWSSRTRHRGFLEDGGGEECFGGWR
jgi:hypothetical protein